MTINFYKNNSENNKIGKSLSLLFSLSGNLRDESSILNPVFKISGKNVNEVYRCNYVYIPEFARYYFVTDIKSIRNNLIEISCKVDVLESFKNEILSQQAIIKRQQSKWNIYLDDGTFKTYQNPRLKIRNFPNSFNTESFILIVAGG